MADLLDFNYAPLSAKFDGSDIVRSLDHVRLTGQMLKVSQLMQDQKWRTLSEIEKEISEPQASISAQLRNLRKDKFGAHVVNRQRRGDPRQGLFEYQLIPKIAQ